MRNSALYQSLSAFAADAAVQLAAETASGAEVPFEIVEGGWRDRRRAPLYCYRPLTGAFIRERVGVLAALPTYAPAVRGLVAADGLDAYLRARDEPRIPEEPRERAEAALRSFLGAVFEERSDFGLDPERFARAYEELERIIYAGRCTSWVIAPVLGLGLDHSIRELPLGDGLSLLDGELLEDAPAEAVWGAGEQPSVLAVLTVTQERSVPAPVSVARARFRRLLTALRLFERGGYALGPVGWTRMDAGSWRPVPLGASGRPRFLTLVSAAQEDELRAFCNLVARRAPSSGEVAWALARFEMGYERLAPFEMLTDHLLALRALLEPEGPASGRLAGRLAALCADPEGRAALAERTAYAISLERAVIAGLAPAEPGVNALVDEVAEHLRSLLRDVLCGHLDADLRGLADTLIGSASAAPA